MVIVQGAVSPDHVHMLVSVPPQLAPVRLVLYPEGRSSRMLQGRVSPTEEAALWTINLGARVFLCERRRGGRGYHQEVHRKSTVGGSR